MPSPFRPATELMVQYAAYHRDRRNIATHFVGIPLIVFAIGIFTARAQFDVSPVHFTAAWALWVVSTAWYLTREWRDGHAADAVARFHLGNGARLEQLNPLGDLSEKGIAQSYGLMVNYLYDLDHIEENHETFANKGEVVASSAIRKLAKVRAGALEPTRSVEN